MKRMTQATTAQRQAPADSDGAKALKPIALVPPDTAGNRQLGEVVADAIVAAIAQGTLSPGQRVVEQVLAKELAVSRVPIREAIKILHAQGILTVTPNRGARVTSFDAQVIDQVDEARIALEQIAAHHAIAVYQREPRRLDKLHAIVSRMERVARWSDWSELRVCDLAFHHEMCRASGNDIVLKLWEALARHITIIFGREIAAERDFSVVIKQHEKLVGMLERGDPDIGLEIERHIRRLRPKVLARPTRPSSRRKV